MAVELPTRKFVKLRLPPGYRLVRSSDRGERVVSGEPRMDRYQPDWYVEQSKLPGHIVVVRVAKKKLVAVHHMFIEEDLENGEAYLMLDMLNVDRSFQGQHVGSMMVEIGEDIAGQLGVRELRLEALNRELIPYYLRFGFVLENRELAYPDWGTVYPMRKRLN